MERLERLAGTVAWEALLPLAHSSMPMAAVVARAGIFQPSPAAAEEAAVLADRVGQELLP